MRDNVPSYWAVIPAHVRYDPELRPNAKLLYGELSALATADGYCWATDKFFANLFDLSVNTINELISSLAQKHYIRIEYAATKKGRERRIYVGFFTVTEGSPEKSGYPEKSEEGSPEKSGLHKDNNINNNNNTPHSPPKGAAPKSRKQARPAPDYCPDDFAEFWKLYPRGEDKQGAMDAWDELAPDEEMLARIFWALKLSRMTDEWQRGVGIPYAVRWLRRREFDNDKLGTDVQEHRPPAKGVDEW